MEEVRRVRKRQGSVHIDTGECIRAFFHEASSRHQVGGGRGGTGSVKCCADTSPRSVSFSNPCRERCPTETSLSLLEHPNMWYHWKQEPLFDGAEVKAALQPVSASFVICAKPLFLNSKVKVLYPISISPVDPLPSPAYGPHRCQSDPT